MAVGQPVDAIFRSDVDGQWLRYPPDVSAAKVRSRTSLP